MIVGAACRRVFGEFFAEKVGKFRGRINIVRLGRFGNICILEIAKEVANVVQESGGFYFGSIAVGERPGYIKVMRRSGEGDVRQVVSP